MNNEIITTYNTTPQKGIFIPDKKVLGAFYTPKHTVNI